MSLRPTITRVAIAFAVIVACLSVVSSAGAVQRKAGEAPQEFPSPVAECHTYRIPLVGSFTICT
jgi:hypothetical protein